MSTENTRGLSSEFMDKLKEGGKWNFITEEVKRDHTLHFQIRDNYINIYYRGCSVLRLEEKGMSKNSIAKEYYEENIDDIFEWADKLPYIKQGVDYYLSKINKLEREFQQLVARDNTFSKVSNGTDYFIVDTEMADTDNNSRFDMVAIKWERGNRKNIDDCQLSIIEMKYGQNAFDNFKKHFTDIISYHDSGKIDILKVTAVEQFKQLRELELVALDKSKNEKENEKLKGEDINEDEIELKPERIVEELKLEVEFIILLANYNPDSTKINKHLSFMKEMDATLKAKGITLKFATSNFMGYGLYDERMLSLEDFEKLLKK